LFQWHLYLLFLPRIYNTAPKPDPVKPRPPTARRFYFTELAVPLVYICLITSSPTLLIQLRSQAAFETHHAACLLFLGRSDCAPRVSIASFPGVPQVSPRPQRPPTYPSDWLLPPRPTGLAPMTTAKLTLAVTLGPPGEASPHAGRAKIPEDDPTTTRRPRTTTSPIAKFPSRRRCR